MGQIGIIGILELPPPFILDGTGGITPGDDTTVSDELVLETPSILVTGSYYNPETGEIEAYNREPLQFETLQSNSTFQSRTRRTFIGPITIEFESRYPLKTYPNITRASNQFIGDPPFGYQANRAEIRYNFAGGGVHKKSTLYKRALTLKHNTAGSDNIIFNYKLFYKGKKSHTGSVNISIYKTDDQFYSFDENG